MTECKALFFDADDTLLNHSACERQALIYLFKKIGLTYNDEYHNIFRLLDKDLWKKAHKNVGPINKDEVPTYRFKRLFEIIDAKYKNHVEANKLFKEGFSQASVLNDNAEKTVSALFHNNYLICVVTNGLVSLQKPRLLDSKLGKYISNIIVSEEVGVRKPNPLMITKLMKTLCLNNQSAIMIGDSLEKDIMAAKNANINSIWYNPEKQDNQTNITPDFEVNNLLQIIDIV